MSCLKYPLIGIVLSVSACDMLSHSPSEGRAAFPNIAPNADTLNAASVSPPVPESPPSAAPVIDKDLASPPSVAGVSPDHKDAPAIDQSPHPGENAAALPALPGHHPPADGAPPPANDLPAGTPAIHTVDGIPSPEATPISPGAPHAASDDSVASSTAASPSAFAATKTGDKEPDSTPSVFSTTAFGKDAAPSGDPTAVHAKQFDLPDGRKIKLSGIEVTIIGKDGSESPAADGLYVTKDGKYIPVKDGKIQAI